MAGGADRWQDVLSELRHCDYLVEAGRCDRGPEAQLVCINGTCLRNSILGVRWLAREGAGILPDESSPSVDVWAVLQLLA